MRSNNVFDASHDFTEKDQATLNWLKMKERNQFRGELFRSAKQTAKMATKDVVFVMACVALLISIVLVCAVIGGLL